MTFVIFLFFGLEQNVLESNQERATVGMGVEEIVEHVRVALDQDPSAQTAQLYES